MATRPVPRTTLRPARASCDHGRPRARDRQLLLVLALVDVLVDGRADDLPARLRLRLRLAREPGRRLRLRRVRRHRHRRDRGPLLERVPGDVRDVRQVPVPAHLRRDPRRARRHRGARHRRGALDLHAGERLRVRADGRRDLLRPRPVLGDARSCPGSPSSRASAGRASGSPSPASRSPSRTSTTSSAPCSRRSSSSPGRSSRSTPCRSGRRSWPTSTRSTSASSSCGARSSAWRGGSTLPASACLVAFGLVLWRIAIHAMTRKLVL